MGFQKEKYVTTQDGIRLYVRVYGDSVSKKIPVVCLPGLTRNSKDFYSLATHLSQHRRVICPDLRGRGKSEYDIKPNNYWRPEVYVIDILSIMTALNAHRAIFIGTSLGGMISMQMAVARPSAVAGIVLNDIGPEIPGEAVKRISKNSAKSESFDSWEKAATQQQQLHHSVHPQLSDLDWLDLAKNTFKEDNGRIVSDYDLQIGTTMRPNLVPSDFWPLFFAVKEIPTVAIRGDLSDVLTEKTFEKMKASYPALEQVVIPDCGHSPFLNEKEARSAIDSLLEQVDQT